MSNSRGKPFFLGGIAGFGGGEVVQLTKTAETGFGSSNGVLTITDGASTAASLAFSGTYTQQDLNVSTNAMGT